MLGSYLNQIPQMLLLLPSALIALSVHESAHGYVANKLGDPTAKNLGRITLNPAKHFNLLGFISMLFFRIGWANPVPINARYFKKPRRDMALSAAAGPISNLLLAFISTILLRLVAIPLESIVTDNLYMYYSNEELFEVLASNTAFTLLSLLATVLYFSISLNLNLMIFNLIPIPPFDGSRIAYVFLPTDVYFKVMRYERYIMIGFILLFYLGVITLPLSAVSGFIEDFFFDILRMPKSYVFYSINHLLSRLPQFTF